MTELAAAAGISYGTLYRIFGSRDAILRELDHPAPVTARDRILEAAARLVDSHELAQAKMDDVAVAAGVSRATLYRLFPGKARLLRELTRIHSPWEAVPQVLDAMRDRPPEEVVSAVAHTMVARMEGRTGLLLAVGEDLLRQDARSHGESEGSMANGLVQLVGYLRERIAAGHLREADPVVALLLLVGPIVAHVITRGLPLERTGIPPPPEDAIDEIVRSWLRGMAPGSAGRGPGA